MKRVSNTSKSLTNAPTSNNPAVPSLPNTVDSVPFKKLPLLSNFLRSHTVVDIDERRANIYTLKKFIGIKTQLLLKYKIKRTKYKIYSCIRIKVDSKSPTKSEEGYVKITKGFFKSRKFTLGELPKNVIESINNNINKFNSEYSAILVAEKTKKIKKAKKKEQSFFKELDT